MRGAKQWEEEALKKKLDKIYCMLKNSINWITKKSELMQKELDLLHEKEKLRNKEVQSIDILSAPSIDARLADLED